MRITAMLLATAWLLALAPSGLAGDIERLYTFDGDSAGDRLGMCVSGAGDVNADGYDDVIVGAYLDDDNGTDSGSARVFSGKNGATLYTFYGDSAGDNFGNRVSGAGDVNNDGYDDVIVGAPLDDDNGTDCGSARVFSGKDGTILYTFYGDSAGDNLGPVSAAGDLNSDGHDDVIAGANGGDYARVYSGKDGATLYTFYGNSAGDYFGTVSGAGDVNGDGYPDLIVGAKLDDDNGTDSGSARVFSGVNGAILYTFYGDSADDRFGNRVSGAGDVNNDGYDDMVVGARLDDNNGTNSGSARVLSGKDGSTLYTFNGDSAGDQFGCWVSGAGDVNGDGHDDLVVGACKDNSKAGSARVLSGKDGTTLATFYGDKTNDHFGVSVSGAGDVNGDGAGDIIVGGYGFDYNGSASGRAIVYATPDSPPTVVITAPTSGATVSGTSVNIAASASDNGYVAKVEFFVDGNLVATDTTSPYAIAWDSTGVSDGDHSISAKVTDAAGQVGTDSISVAVDNLPDALTVTSISPNSIRAGKSVSVMVRGTEFAAGASLTLANGSGPTVTVSNVVVVDSTTITAKVAAARGSSRGRWTWDVVVTNPGGASVSLVGGFTVKK